MCRPLCRVFFWPTPSPLCFSASTVFQICLHFSATDLNESSSSSGPTVLTFPPQPSLFLHSMFPPFQKSFCLFLSCLLYYLFYQLSFEIPKFLQVRGLHAYHILIIDLCPILLISVKCHSFLSRILLPAAPCLLHVPRLVSPETTISLSLSLSLCPYELPILAK